MKTGAHLKIEPWGENVAGVRLFGDRRRPEHADFVVAFPGGEAIVSRTSGGDYWVHVYTARPGAPGYSPEDGPAGRITSARLDILGRHTSEVDVGDFAHPDLYHLAVRIAPAAAPAAAPAPKREAAVQVPLLWAESEATR